MSQQRRRTKRKAGFNQRQRDLRTRRLHCERLEDRRMLAVVTVTTNQDVVELNDGVTSLREAVATANESAGTDVIRFDFGHDGPETIVLTEGALEITDHLIVRGSAAELLTIDSQLQSQIFVVNSYRDSASLSLFDLTLTGGNGATGYSNTTSGDAIFAGGSVNLTRTRIIGNGIARFNEHAAIFSTGSILIQDSAINENHGGVYSRQGSVTLIGSQVSGNQGAGIYASDSSVTVFDSRIESNSTGIRGVNESSVTVSDSDIIDNGPKVVGNTANSLSGGGISNHGAVTLYRSRIDGNTSEANGGGIFATGAVTIIDSELTNNQASRNGGGIYVDALGTLTLVNSILTGNHAGFYGGGGVFSRGTDVILIKSEVTENKSGGSGAGIFASDGNVTLTESIVTGNQAEGAGGGILVNIGDVNLLRSTVSNNRAYGNFNRSLGGGGILVSGNLTIVESEVSNNFSTLGAGGINALGSQVVIQDSLFEGNRAQVGVGESRVDNGGAILTSGESVSISGSTFTNNRAQIGGAIYSFSEVVSIADTTFEGNEATEKGGGIYTWNILPNSLSLTNSILRDNRADLGGGIYAGGELAILQSMLIDNHADQGGGIYAVHGVEARHSTIFSNSADSFGGGIFSEQGTLTLDHTVVAGNTAPLGPDVTGYLGVEFDLRYSLIGNNANTGLVEAPLGNPDAQGNLLNNRA